MAKIHKLSYYSKFLKQIIQIVIIILGGISQSMADSRISEVKSEHLVIINSCHLKTFYIALLVLNIFCQ